MKHTPTRLYVKHWTSCVYITQSDIDPSVNSSPDANAHKDELTL